MSAFPITSTPPAIMAAVQNGKHVICEKPMCISLKEADEIVAAVDDGRYHLYVRSQRVVPPRP